MRHLLPVLAGLALVACETTSPVAGVYCTKDADCAGATPVCDVPHNSCVAGSSGGEGGLPVDAAVGEGGALDLAAPDLAAACHVSLDCPVTMPVCTAGACGPCTLDGACAGRATTPRCLLGPGACVECLTAGDCVSRNLACDTTKHQCGPCSANGDCASGLCEQAACINTTDIVYVDNRDNVACTGTHTGSQMDPYCQITDALSNLGGKHHVLVAGHATTYGAVTVNNAGTVIVVGGGAMRPAIAGAGKDAFKAQGTSIVTLVHFDLSGGGAGASCSGGATLTLVDDAMHDDVGPGVLANMCTLRMDADTVGPSNLGGGISLTSTQYTIENSFVAKNGPNGPGILISDNASTGVLQFDTVVENVEAGKSAGIVCPTTDHAITSSIVWSNTPKSGTQLSGMCSLMNVVTGTDSWTGAIQKDPTFVDEPNGNFHLKMGDAANVACCFDKVTGPDGGGGLPTHDVDFEVRPKGAGWDVGADEAQ